MAKIKYTKNELKYQKDALSRFQRYLPTLMLKKQQLQMEIRKVEALQRQKMTEKDHLNQEIRGWVELFGEEAGIDEIVKIRALKTEKSNIAGVNIPLFDSIEFEDILYDLFEVPLWVDAAVDRIKKLTALAAQIHIQQEQINRLGEELRITSQRVNLFEKVKIPESKENIRVIQIYLGDQQTAAVVRGKMSKKKLVKVS